MLGPENHPHSALANLLLNHVVAKRQILPLFCIQRMGLEERALVCTDELLGQNLRILFPFPLRNLGFDSLHVG